jgi:hypothetical protein
MYVRQTTLQGDPSKLEAFLQFFHEQLPTLRRQRMRELRVLAERDSGTVLVASLWENSEDAAAAEATIGPLRSQSAQLLGATAAPTSELFEVLVMETISPIPPV